MTASRTLMATLFVAAVWGGATPTAPADACGVKLLLRTGAIKPQHGVKRSSNPSRVLLVGDPPRKMVRELKQMGHQVDVAQSPETAKTKDYKVVVANRDNAATARQRFPNAKVVAANDARQVDASLARERVASRSASRTPVAVQVKRAPVAAGPDDKGGDYRRLIQAKPADTEPKPEPKATAEPKAEPKVAAVTPEPKPEPKPAKIDTSDTSDKPADEPPPTKSPIIKQTPKPGAEIVFALGGSSLQRTTRADAWVKWLTANPGASIVIEGHADTTGDEDANMALSQRRAETVRDHFAAAGIDASRLEVTAHGETQPKYGDGRDGRNRRVQITVKK